MLILLSHHRKLLIVVLITAALEVLPATVGGDLTALARHIVVNVTGRADRITQLAPNRILSDGKVDLTTLDRHRRGAPR